MLPINVNPNLQKFLRGSRGFDMILSEDASCAFASTKEGFRRFRFGSTSDEPPINVVAYRNQTHGGYYFYRAGVHRSDQDKSVDVIIDRAWGSSNSNNLVISAHLPYKLSDLNRTMFMIRLDWDRSVERPFTSVALEYKSDQEPAPIAISINLDSKSAPAWYWWGPSRIQPQMDRLAFSRYLSPAEDNSAWAVGGLFLPRGCFERFNDDANLACSYDSMKSEVTFSSSNANVAQKVVCPAKTGNFDITAQGIIVETYDERGNAKELFRLDRSRWISLGPILFEGRSATGELSLTKNLATGELTLSKI